MIFCMYGTDKEHHLHSPECIINGQKFIFSPVDVLHHVPAARTPKAMKYAAAYIVALEDFRIPLQMRQIRNWARHSQSRSRIGRPRRLPERFFKNTFPKEWL